MEEREERRHSIRVRSLNFVNLDPEKENEVIHSLGRTLELNLMGATIELSDKLPVGAAIELELATGETITTLQGTVINVHPSESGLYRVGIEFSTPHTIYLA